eukprot:12099073-Alexandrium_andersonii.AAC.1
MCTAAGLVEHVYGAQQDCNARARNHSIPCAPVESLVSCHACWSGVVRVLASACGGSDRSWTGFGLRQEQWTDR